MEADNAFLAELAGRLGKRFALTQAKLADLYRPISLKAGRLQYIPCHQVQHYISARLTFSYARHLILLGQDEVAKTLAGK